MIKWRENNAKASFWLKVTSEDTESLRDMMSLCTNRIFECVISQGKAKNSGKNMIHHSEQSILYFIFNHANPGLVL